MNPIQGYPNRESTKENVFRKWNAFSSDFSYDEDDRTEHIVTTLYAKPSTGKPFLTMGKLKKCEYEETTFFSLNTYLLFSDIGRAAWSAVLEINRNSTIELAGASLLEEDKSWQVRIKNSDLTILLNSIRFRPIGKYTSAFYVSIEIGSKPATLLAFVKLMMEALNRKPWEDETGELDWGNFTRKTFMPRKEVIEQWALLSDLPEMLPDSMRQNIKPSCQRCMKSMEKDWIICPFCATPSKDYQKSGLF